MSGTGDQDHFTLVEGHLDGKDGKDDGAPLRPAPGRPALVAMLVLTQFSVGLFLVEGALRAFAPGSEAVRTLLIVIAAALGFVGIGAGFFRSRRRLPGLRASWPGRESAAFGLFAALVGLHLALTLLSPLGSGRLPSALVDPVFHAVAAAWGPEAALRALDVVGQTAVRFSGGGLVTATLAASGLLAVGASVMSYAGAGRELWRLGRTAFRFYGTVLLLGTAWAAPFLLQGGVEEWLFHGTLLLLMAVTVLKIGLEAVLFAGPVLAKKGAPSRKAALLLLGPLLDVFRLRCLAGLVGGIVLPDIALSHIASPRMALAVSGVAALFVLIGEVCERHLFFAAAAVRKGPNGV